MNQTLSYYDKKKLQIVVIADTHFPDGYLADDIYKVRVPLGILSEVTGDAIPFRWDFVQERAFEAIKQYTVACTPHSHVPLNYGRDAGGMTDACLVGIGRVIAQGKDWHSGKTKPCHNNYL